MRTATARRSKTIGVAVWILQGLLALFFAAGSGAPKLLVPGDTLPMPIPLPAGLLLFIGTCEVLGALGLILPGLTGVRPGLTRIPERLRSLASAWRDAAARAGMTRAGGVDLPAEVAGVVALNEVVVHGWDIAVSSGQPFTCAPHLLEAPTASCSPPWPSIRRAARACSARRCPSRTMPRCSTG